MHQENCPYTAFEVNRGLYQFTVMSFGITNRIACFQRAIDNFISEQELVSTYASKGNMTKWGLTENEHDKI